MLGQLPSVEIQASEAYTLRQHIDFVRDAVKARTGSRSSPAAVHALQRDTVRP
jgi:hypothetical protein